MSKQLTQDELTYESWKLYQQGRANHIECGAPGSSHEGRDVLMSSGQILAWAPRADA